MFKKIALLLLFSMQLFAQDKSLLIDELKKEAVTYKEVPGFAKTQAFFVDNNWDSTLIYSMIAINSTKNDTVLNYSHYCRGIALKKKRLLADAAAELNKISPSFRFYYKVRLNLGEIAIDRKDYHAALDYFGQIEQLPDREQYDFKQSSVLHNKGICYLHLEDYANAEKYLFKSIALQEQQKDSLRLISGYMDIANLYYVQFKDQQAIPYFKKAYDLSKLVASFPLKQNAALNMAVVEETRNDLKAAMKYRKEYEKWKDSVNDQNKVWAIAAQEKKLALMQKQKEIDLLATTNKLQAYQRNAFLFGLVISIIVLAMGAWVYYQKLKSNRIILAQKNELDVLNATKDKIFSIVSHDLRSSVNALKTSNNKLSVCLATQDYVQLEKLLINNNYIASGAYSLLDNLLNWALLQTRQLYFHQETVHLHSVVLQVTFNYRPLLLNKNLRFETTVDRAIYVNADQDSLKIILRNLLDNAIRYSKEQDVIKVYATATGDLIVEDTGPGMSEETRLLLLNGQGSGLGLRLCRELAQKNGGQLAIESQEQVGTKIIISLPLSPDHG